MRTSEKLNKVMSILEVKEQRIEWLIREKNVLEKRNVTLLNALKDMVELTDYLWNSVLWENITSFDPQVYKETLKAAILVIASKEKE